ncbi:ROK family protein [Deinococcus altitudinis]|uniref:ROK family protein n=1 Tax=Deinococcus altitudinis TaxID=468914 RepID=UPI0038912699
MNETPVLDTLALDVGGSHVTAARVGFGPQGPETGPCVRLHLDEHAPADELLDTFAHAALMAVDGPSLDGSALGTRDLAAIGVGMPGPFDYVQGTGRFTGKFLALNGVDVGAGLRARLPALSELPLAFLNDAAAFALGEAELHGDAGRTGRTLGVTLGTGLGSGFVEADRVRMGGAGVAREGQIGWEPYLDATAEDYVSTRRLISDYASLSGERLRPVEISARARAGDAHAQAVFAAYGRHLGSVLAEWVRAFSPGRIVLGGNLCAARKLFLPELETALRGKLDGQARPDLDFSADGERAALVGAAWSVHGRLPTLLSSQRSSEPQEAEGGSGLGLEPRLPSP